MRPPSEFPDFEIGKRDLLPALMSGISHAAELHGHRTERMLAPDTLFDLAFAASLQSVNALMASSATRCRIGAPPTADVEMVTDVSGKLIYRCKHASPHKWDLNGNPIP